jgi:hypothetical protein
MLNLPYYELDPPFRGATHVKIYHITVGDGVRFIARLGEVVDGAFVQDDAFSEQVRQLTPAQEDAFAEIVGPAFAQFAEQYAHQIIYGTPDPVELTEPEEEA